MHPIFSAILFLPFVSAITFETPSNITSGGPATINWTPDSTDPATFSLELVNPSFHDTFAIANNVRTPAGTIIVNLPIVPAGDNYQIEAVQISNINDVFGTSSPFTIAPTVTTTSSSASTASPLSSVSGASAAAATTGATSSGPSTSGSSQASSTSPSSFNGNGALGRSITGGNVGSIAAAVVGIIAGAVLV